ncbi:MAG: DUF4292 domain-containing protein [Chitinophagaceae bacterium]
MLYSSIVENEGLGFNDSILLSQKRLEDRALINSIFYTNKHTDIQTVKIKTKVYVQAKEEKQKINFSMETRIFKDSVFWCSMTYFGIEILRIKATKKDFLVKIIGENNAFHLHQLLENQYDSTLVFIKKHSEKNKQDNSIEIDKLNNMKSMLDYIKENPQEVFMFMNLCFLGNFPFQKIVSDSIWYNNITQQYTINYSFPQGKLIALFSNNIGTYLLDKFFMKQGKIYVDINFLEYELIGKNNFLPKKFMISNQITNIKNQHQTLQFIFQTNTIKPNIALDFPMSSTKK